MSSTARRARPTSGKRRGAPSERDRLSRDRVVAEALALLDREGQDRFSVRRLADRLGVTPMAVYNHVNSKRDLLQAVAEAVVTGANYRPVSGGWEKVVHGCFRTLRKACLAHPGAMPLVEASDTLPAAIFRPMEITLNALQGAGVKPEDAVRAYFVLVTFTLGQVKYQLRGWSRGVDRAAALRDGRIDEATFPAVTKATTADNWDFDEFFEFGLSLIIAGIAGQTQQV